MIYESVLLLLAVDVCMMYNVALPTIFWDPINPIFACELKINVKLFDVLNFQCPTENTPYSHPLTGVADKLYETAYLVDECMYNECNATLSRKTLLQCHLADRINFRMNFRIGSPAPGALKFKEGATYYVIGTSFRTVENVDNKINGSCNTDNADNAIPEYKLRLKIYVCTTEELESGECEICSNTACYMKGCGKNCSDWATDYSKIYKNSIDECFSPQSRTCVNKLLGTTEREYRETNVSCPNLPTNNCTMWVDDISRVSCGPVNCSVVEERSCTLTGIELRLVDVTCLTTKLLPSTATVSLATTTVSPTEHFTPKHSARKYNQSADSTIYGLSVACVLLFITGVVIGVVLHIKLHNRSQVNAKKNNLNKTESHCGLVNDSFRHSTAFSDKFVSQLTEIGLSPKEAGPI